MSSLAFSVGTLPGLIGKLPFLKYGKKGKKQTGFGKWYQEQMGELNPAILPALATTASAATGIGIGAGGVGLGPLSGLTPAPAADENRKKVRPPRRRPDRRPRQGSRPPLDISQSPQRVYVEQGGNYQRDLTDLEAFNKSNQLLARATKGQQWQDKAAYKQIMSATAADLQKGGDYGADMGRFYDRLSAAGITPYKGREKGIGSDQAGDYGQFVNQAFRTSDSFFDKEDFGRRILEAKAFYRPGGDKTNLGGIGVVANRITDQGTTFYGDTGASYKGGWRDYGGLVTPGKPRPGKPRPGKGSGVKPGKDPWHDGWKPPSWTGGGPVKPGVIYHEDTFGRGGGRRGHHDTKPPAGGSKSGRPFDFTKYGLSGFGGKDLDEMRRRGWGDKEIFKQAETAKSQGRNIGKRVQKYIASRSKPSRPGGRSTGFPGFGKGFDNVIGPGGGGRPIPGSSAGSGGTWGDPNKNQDPFGIYNAAGKMTAII